MMFFRLKPPLIDGQGDGLPRNIMLFLLRWERIDSALILEAQQ
jgi:hypothetical protein